MRWSDSADTYGQLIALFIEQTEVVAVAISILVASFFIVGLFFTMVSSSPKSR